MRLIQEQYWGSHIAWTPGKFRAARFALAWACSRFWKKKRKAKNCLKLPEMTEAPDLLRLNPPDLISATLLCFDELHLPSPTPSFRSSYISRHRFLNFFYGIASLSSLTRCTCQAQLWVSQKQLTSIFLWHRLAQQHQKQSNKGQRIEQNKDNDIKILPAYNSPFPTNEGPWIPLRSKNIEHGSDMDTSNLLDL